MKLKELLSAAGLSVPAGAPEVTISQVTDDSRSVRPGALFVAVPGASVDGHRFLAKAVEQGAVAVMAEQDVPVPAPAVKIRVPSTRAALGPLANAFWGFPSKRLKVLGVTGTKGKTTVAWGLQHLLEAAGLRCGLIGTVCHRLADGEHPSDNTTPGALFLQENLERMAGAKFKACAMEVSSHALDQRRTDGILWTCGVFTNFAPEHLDYHETLERYLEAKLRLFRSLPEDSHAVINRDDPSFEKVRGATRARVVTYGLKAGADFTAREVRGTLEGTRFTLETPEGSFPAVTPLIGLHNLENLLAAVGAAVAAGVPAAQAARGLSTFAGVPGRLERIECGQPFPVFVDYAHTDGALRRVLEQLKGLGSRKILTVFGCGGNRDKTKRPRMGQAAAELSDRVIITSDNPRGEDPAAIAREILSGARKGEAPAEVILDRREAIRAALESADEGWLVLIAGKGHEAAQIFADRSVPFDDRAVVRELLFNPEEVMASARGGVSIDTRAIQPGQLFVAIRGKRFDGNEFVAEAFRRGAAAAVVERLPAGGAGGKPVWQVPDTLEALGALARFHRDRFQPDLVAITGSSGKSTTKTMLAHLLSEDREVLATPGTQNNRIGVPLTLFQLQAGHRAVVLELGTNQWGEIRTLTEISRPTVGVVTNIGPAHLKTFGDLEGVLKAKGELWEGMEPSAVLVLNGDDPLLAKAGRSLRRKVVWYGTGPAAEARATQIRLSAGGGSSSFRVNGVVVNLPVPGRHNVMNGLAALACAKVLGMDLNSAARRLGSFVPLPGRLNITERAGLLILDDSYNGNPASLRAALEVMREIQRPGGRKVVALGDMLELGEGAQELHAEAGRQIMEHGADALVTVGPLAGRALEAAREAGLSPQESRPFDAPEQAGEFLAGFLRPGDLLLLKGSRGTQMEKVLACFTTSSIR